MDDIKRQLRMKLVVHNVFLIFLISLILLVSNNLFAQNLDKIALLNKVTKITMPDTPNYICGTFLCNEQPQIIATAKGESVKYQFATIVTSKLGKGKILFFGSNYYLKKPLPENPDIKQLIENTLLWANHNQQKKIQIWSDDSDLKSFFYKQKNSKCFTDTNSVNNSADIIILTKDVTDSSKTAKIEAFIRSGGTLIFGSPLADIINKNKLNYYELSLNKLFIKAGLYHVPIAVLPNDNNNQLNIGAIPAYLHITNLLKAFRTPGFEPDANVAEAYANTFRLFLAFNPDLSPLSNQIKSTLNLNNQHLIIPSPQSPVKKSDVRKYLTYQLQQFLTTKKLSDHPNPNYIDPASKVFPGEVTKEAQRINKQVVIPVHVGTQGLFEPIDPIFYRWHSTGLYVVAGEKVTVTIPTSYFPQHLKAKIGVHDDNLGFLDYFTRKETDLTNRFELEKESTEISSAYGGILVINIPDTSSLKTITVQVNGAVQHPYFKLGETSINNWKKTIRNYPAPWAELATDKIILTVPAYRIRALDDPEKLLRFWDEVMDADAELANISKVRLHPERIVVDQQVAYGYMFTATYKIVVPDDQSCEHMLDENYMRTNGSWGHFHELGHRHQFWGIDFTELGEVTENLYTMYIYDQVLHKGIYNHEGMTSRAEVISKVKEYMSNSPSFVKWGKDPFIALAMYIELIEGFGWKPIQQVFKDYRQLPKAQYPITQADKRDYWFKKICAATQKDLSVFFDKWKVPITNKVKQSASTYPVWLPEELK